MVLRPPFASLVRLGLPLLCCQEVLAWGKSAAAVVDDIVDDPNVLHRELRGITEKTVPIRTHSIYARESAGTAELVKSGFLS